MKIVLICGDRNWQDPEPIRKLLVQLKHLGYSTLVEGEQRGADAIARELAKMYGLKVLPFPAKWEEYGKAAGPIRNQQMLDEGKPDLVAFFHLNLEHSRGTKDMITRARKAKVAVIDGMKEKIDA